MTSYFVINFQIVDSLHFIIKLKLKTQLLLILLTLFKFYNLIEVNKNTSLYLRRSKK